ncbi:MAG TPA: hypothetical protein VFR84_10835 [Candidatus Angelobacter sp.]|nr:hypothetical protein [Candidatus Angelobacter sp.]
MNILLAQISSDEKPTGLLFPKRTYILAALGDARAADETALSVRFYNTSDGVHVTTAHGTFKTEKAATAELERLMKAARRVREQSVKKGRFGGTVGKRIVIESNLGSNEMTFSIVWTNLNEFYEITSKSLSAALELEARYYS